MIIFFVLYLRLAFGEPVIAVATPDCNEAHAWYAEATAWAIRSGLQPGQGPMYACVRFA